MNHKRKPPFLSLCQGMLIVVFMVLLTSPARAIINPPDPDSKSSKEKKAPHIMGEVLVKLRTAPAPQKSSNGALSLSSSSPKLDQWIKGKQGKVNPIFKGSPKGQSKARNAAPSDQGLDRWMKFETASKQEDPNQLCQELMSTGEVESCQPNYIMTIQSTLPNDTYIDPDQDGTWSTGAWTQDFEDMWGLKMVQAVETWNAPGCNNNCKGEGVIVAVVDTGLDYTHPDLCRDTNQNGTCDSGEQYNVYINPNEIPDNGIDDDGNGYVDDIHGWDFVNNDANPMDDHGHGTHVSGTIAAVADNGIGIAGVAPKAKILPIKGLGNGGGETADLAAAIVYAADMGADVINNSWGCMLRCSTDQVKRDAVRHAFESGSVVVFSAGNSVDDAAFYGLWNMEKETLIVAAVDHFGKKAWFSNYGAIIDFAAPGGGETNPNNILRPDYSILSLRAQSSFHSSQLTVGNNLFRLGGTSMSAPHVAGVAALIKGNNPMFGPEQVEWLLKANLRNFDITPSKPIGAGILNAAAIFHPTARVEEYHFFPSTQVYIRPNEERSLSFRIVLANMVAPFAATIETTNPDIQIVQPRATFSQEEASPFANNDMSRFSLIFTGVGPYFVGDIPITLYIEEYDTQFFATIHFDEIQALPGWPKTVDGDVYSSPAIADLDPDYHGLEIVVGSDDHYLDGSLEKNVYAWHSDGSLVSGWPQTTNGLVDSSPAVADLDPAYAGLEVVVGSDNITDMFGSRNNVYVWHADGSRFWETAIGLRAKSPPAIADLYPGNTGLEIVMGSENNNVYVWENNGDLLWEKVTAFDVDHAPAISDLDPNSLGLEIVVGAGAKVYALHADGGLWWERATTSEIRTSPAIGNLDGEGMLEVIVCAGKKIYVWHADGSPWWEKEVSSNFISSSPAIADLDGNGTLEIIFGAWDKNVYALQSNGTVLWFNTTNDSVYSSPAVADIDPTYPGLEVVVGSNDKNVYAWHADGTTVSGWPKTTRGFVMSSPSIADLDDNGTLEVIVGSLDKKVYVWTMPYESEDPNPWPMFRHDLQRTGLYTPPSLPNLSNALSRKIHGTANYDIALPLEVGSSAVESRLIDSAHPLQIILGFDQNIDSGVKVIAPENASETARDERHLTVEMASVPNPACLELKLSGVQGDENIHIRTLLGDVTGDGVINLADLSMMKLNLFKPVTSANFRSDVNTDGQINIIDLSIVKSNLFKQAAACSE